MTSNIRYRVKYTASGKRIAVELSDRIRRGGYGATIRRQGRFWAVLESTRKLRRRLS